MDSLKVTLVSKVMIGTLLIVEMGCGSPAGVSTGADSPPWHAPTVADLSGSWTGFGTRGGNAGGTYESTDTYQFGVDGSVSVLRATVTTPPSGSPVTSYSEKRGSFSVSNGSATITFSESRTPTGLIDPSTPWLTSGPETVVYPLVVDGQKLYGLVAGTLFSAEAGTHGLQGTWQATYSGGADSWRRDQMTFLGDGTWTGQGSTRASSSAPWVPGSPASGTYSSDASTVTLTYGSSSAQYYYQVFGPYLHLREIAYGPDRDIYLKN